MNYLAKRFSEKSTWGSIAGLVTAIAAHYGGDTAIAEAATWVFASIAVGIAGTQG